MKGEKQEVRSEVLKKGIHRMEHFHRLTVKQELNPAYYRENQNPNRTQNQSKQPMAVIIDNIDTLTTLPHKYINCSVNNKS